MRMLCPLLLLFVGLAQSASLIQELTFQGHFSSLLELISKAGLTDTLSRGVFTMFAPSDTAIAKLPQLASLSADSDGLKQVLLYHIAPGQIFKSSLENDGKVNTLAGVPLRTNLYKAGLTVNGKAVEATDLATSNGVIHVMHDVIYPIPNASIADILAADPRFTTLVSALTTAGLMKTVSGNRAVTLFAPTNDAFDEVNDLTTLLANKKDIRALLQRHLVSGSLFSIGIANNDQQNTLLGNLPEDQLDFTVKGESGTSTILVDSEVGEATVLQQDILALNGVIHVVDTVI